MHWIQKHIMQELSMHTSCRYSELKPSNVDGNLFMYHMQQLRKDGYVQKNDKGYTLSQKGKLFSSRMSLRQGSALMQPKIVTMLVCQNTEEDYLLFRWSRQPYSGLVSFPFSKVHFGRTIVETLKEALFYKTNLKGNFEYIGNVYIRVLDTSGEIDDHTLAHIYRVTDMEGILGGYDGLTGQPFWGKPKDISVNEHVPGFTDVLELVESGVHGFIREVLVNQSND
jgi:hypothetical protein